jgi:acetylornithine deacetylase/succinyl-diaminopimelate desuccinylase-like protein
MAGSGPMYAFTHTLGLPVASSGAGYPDTRVHAPNENIRLVDYAAAIKHAATIIMRMGELQKE